MKSNVLFTKYAENIGDIPHNYYPRPQLCRDSFFNLNGEWDFSFGEYLYSEEYNEKIIVPFPPESALSGIGRGHGDSDYLHYRREVKLPDNFTRDRLLLHFGAIDQEAWVYINGELVGERLGGYIPFTIDITEYQREESFTLSVVCRDNLDIKYPYGKQTKKRGGMWYTPVSGIWQTVWLEAVTEDYIKSVKITPTERGIILDVVGGRAKKTLDIEGVGSFSFEGDRYELVLDRMEYWTPESPKLYDFTLTSGEDMIRSYFAIRTVSVGECDGVSRLCLNGEPYVFNGLLDQGYFPDGLFLPANIDGYLDDIKLAKSLGYNMLRKHIKIEPDVFYYLCDKEGIAVFQDMVNNSDYSFIRDTALPTIGLQWLPDGLLHRDPESRAIFEKTMRETAELLYNHPSIVYYTIFNEGWGQFTADVMYDKLREIDSTRIIDATSGWFRRTRSDVDSRHIYFKPLKPKGLDKRPLVISEFGGYSYRVPEHLFGDANYGYKSFGNNAEFESALAALYKNEVKPLIERGASAFVYTQLTDVEDETNGLVTYDRAVVKVTSPDTIAAIADCSGKI